MTSQLRIRNMLARAYHSLLTRERASLGKVTYNSFSYLPEFNKDTSNRAISAEGSKV